MPGSRKSKLAHVGSSAAPRRTARFLGVCLISSGTARAAVLLCFCAGARTVLMCSRSPAYMPSSRTTRRAKDAAPAASEGAPAGGERGSTFGAQAADRTGAQACDMPATAPGAGGAATASPPHNPSSVGEGRGSSAWVATTLGAQPARRGRVGERQRESVSGTVSGGVYRQRSGWCPQPQWGQQQHRGNSHDPILQDMKPFNTRASTNS